ncbi:hypothetical protein BJX76DRAFT_342544 [Aspergillus varians]
MTTGRIVFGNPAPTFSSGSSSRSTPVPMTSQLPLSFIASSQLHPSMRPIPTNINLVQQRTGFSYFPAWSRTFVTPRAVLKGITANRVRIQKRDLCPRMGLSLSPSPFRSTL